MTTGKRNPPGGPGAPQRRRRPPTIDLEATEVPVSPRAEQAAATAPVQPPEPEPPAVAEPPPQPATQAAPEATVEPSPEPAVKPREPDPAGTESRARAAEPPRATIAWMPPETPWPLIGAGAAGAASALLVLLVAWLLSPAPPAPSDPATALAPRFSTIETQLRELAARPAPATIDPRAIDQLTSRLSRMESAISAPRPAATDPVAPGRLTAAENAMKSLTDNVAALTRSNDELTATLRTSQSRVDALTSTVAELQKTAHASSVGSDRAVRLAVAASALRSAVERGDPFTAELAVVRPLAADAGALAPLAPFAAGGLPSESSLARELSALLQPILQASGVPPPRGGGFLDRLQANAERLVRIRPVDEVPGDDAQAALARIDARATRGDIAGAANDLAKLPEAARAPLQPWLAKVEARNHALDVARKFAAASVAALTSAP